MNLEDIRKEIDALDPQIRDLLMKRFDCSLRVAESKIESGDIRIYRPERETEILDRLGSSVPEERKPGYLAIIKKIMEASRTYQYGILLNNNEQLFADVPGSSALAEAAANDHVALRFTISNETLSLGSVISILADRGFHLNEIQQIESLSRQSGSCSCMKEADSTQDGLSSVFGRYELSVNRNPSSGNSNPKTLKTLLFQLYMETAEFRIISAG